MKNLLKFNKLMEQSKSQTEIISKKYKNDIEEIINIFNLQFEYFYAHLRVACIDPYVQKYESDKMLGIILINNMYSFYSSIILTQKGLAGSAKIIFRNIFESLIIGKYAALSQDTKFIKKWHNGEILSLKSNVFERVLKPYKDSSLAKLWETLCKFTHSTIYSQQMMEPNDEDIKYNYILIKVLLEMNYHLINSYYINDSL